MKPSSPHVRRPQEKPQPFRHGAAQWNALRKLLHHVSRTVFAEKRPLDRVLSACWRENRLFGSRDRRVFSETLFAIFRYWGWLQSLLSPEEAAAFASGEGWKLPEAAAARLAAAAWLLENDSSCDMLDSLAARFRWRLPGAAAGAAPEERLAQIFTVFRPDRPVPAADREKLLPGWAAEKLRETPGYADWLKALPERPRLWLRSQTADTAAVMRELTAAGLQVERHSHAARALAVTGGAVNLYTLEPYRKGLVEVQDLSSQAIVLAAAPRRRERWLDLCAGAGGKTLALAEAMERTGTVVASDIRAYKLDDLRKRARRAGFPNIMIRPWDGGKIPGRQAGMFDGVLVDAPCSCSGVWRRNPDGRWTSGPEEVRAMAAVQREILANAAPAVRPGGVLIYATCSVFPEENEEVVRDFLAENREFAPEAFPHPLTGEEVPDGVLRLDGSHEHADNMFVARLRRQGAGACPADALGEQNPPRHRDQGASGVRIS